MKKKYSICKSWFCWLQNTEKLLENAEDILLEYMNAPKKWTMVDEFVLCYSNLKTNKPHYGLRLYLNSEHKVSSKNQVSFADIVYIPV